MVSFNYMRQACDVLLWNKPTCQTSDENSRTENERQ